MNDVQGLLGEIRQPGESDGALARRLRDRGFLVGHHDVTSMLRRWRLGENYPIERNRRALVEAAQRLKGAAP